MTKEGATRWKEEKNAGETERFNQIVFFFVLCRFLWLCHNRVFLVSLSLSVRNELDQTFTRSAGADKAVDP